MSQQNAVCLGFTLNQSLSLLSRISNLYRLEDGDIQSCYTWVNAVQNRDLVHRYSPSFLLPANRLVYAYRFGQADFPLRRLCTVSNCVNPHHYEEIEYKTRKPTLITVQDMTVPEMDAAGLDQELPELFRYVQAQCKQKPKRTRPRPKPGRTYG